MKFSAVVILFLTRFNLARYVAKSEEADPNDENAKSAKEAVKVIVAMQGDKDEVAVDIEISSLFAHAVGKETRWFSSCRCHDHIWRLPISHAEKVNGFELKPTPQQQIAFGVASEAASWQGDTAERWSATCAASHRTASSRLWPNLMGASAVRSFIAFNRSRLSGAKRSNLSIDIGNGCHVCSLVCGRNLRTAVASHRWQWNSGTRPRQQDNWIWSIVLHIDL